LLFLPGHLQHETEFLAAVTNVLAKFKAPYLLLPPGHVQHTSAIRVLAAFKYVLAKFKAHYLSRVPQKKKTQVRLDHSPAPTQLALLSPICFDV
jgi:hypothetical protein